MTQLIIGADIGGTSSRLAFFRSSNAEHLELEATIWLKTGEAASFADLLSAFEQLPDCPAKLREASAVIFAIAGPIENESRCHPPNIAWDVDLDLVREPFGLKQTILINDFVAQAWATGSPISEQALIIRQQPIYRDRVFGVIGAGTGLGKALLVPAGAAKFALPSEGGHASFPVTSVEEFRFYEFLRSTRKLDAPTYDDVVSGRGIAAVHEFLTGEKCSPAEITSSNGPESPTMQWASRFYGRACRNFALETFCAGGLFIAGGVAAKVPTLVQSAAFHEEFLRAPTEQHAPFLEALGVRLLVNEESGLWGAGFCGLMISHDRRSKLL